jgi:hypothetical protein
MTNTDQLQSRLRNLYRTLIIELGHVHDQINEAGKDAWEGPLADIDELIGKNNWVALELAAGRTALRTQGDALAHE